MLFFHRQRIGADDAQLFDLPVEFVPHLFLVPEHDDDASGAGDAGVSEGRDPGELFRHIVVNLAMAMESRCYHGGEGRTRLRVLKITKNDWIACAVMALLIALIILEGIFL